LQKADIVEIFDTFESSQLFDFSVDKNCNGKSHITFQVWDGREEKYFKAEDPI